MTATTTVLFVHGTGAREAAVDATCARIRKGLEKARPDVSVERCYWGQVGATLRAGGRSFYFDQPDPDATGDAEAGESEETVSKEEEALACWAQLFADPLFEIRLRQGTTVPAVDPLGDRTTVAARMRKLSGHDEVGRELDQDGLRAAFEAAVKWVVESPEFGSLYGRWTGRHGDTEAMLSRAIVARCLVTAACDGVELSGEHRDELTRVVQDGFGPRDQGGIGDFGDLAKSLALHTLGPSLRRRRRAAIDSAGDILRYQGQGEAIGNYVKQAIERAAGDVVLLAHSLGGIIAVDLLAGQRSRILDKVRLLVTVGSQAPLLYEIGALRCGLTHPAPLPEHFQARWINVYDRRDLLAYAGGELFKDRCTDEPVNTKMPFPMAHSAYWDTGTFYDLLVNGMQAEGI